ncbi:MAG: NUDIX hydrolase [Acidimicrobiales bacterium]|nr:NUDIX hydrolase [Acidimicrobiales bacterium]
MTGFKKLHEDHIHQGYVISLATGHFETPTGEPMTRDIVHHPGAVSVVAVRDGRAIMVRQYRAACDVELLEIPAGKRDIAAEPPELTAERELAEEVGLQARDFILLSRFYNSAGFCDEFSWVFLTTDFVDVPVDLQGPEEQHMSIEWVDLTSVPAMIADGRLQDAKSIIGLTLARAHLGI